MGNANDIQFYKMFGKRVKTLRKDLKISQSDLGGRAELEKTAIQRIERGCNSTLKTLLKLAIAFNISVSELLDFTYLQDCKKPKFLINKSVI